MEPYNDFLAKVNNFEKEQLKLGDGYFHANPRLAQKVRRDGKFTDFFGDRIAFRLDYKTIKRLSEITDALYSAAPECFAERLRPDNFHMTLHDLSSSSRLSDIAERMFFNELEVAKLSEDIISTGFTMKSNYIFNMLNTGIVCGLVPADEEEYKSLMSYYYHFDDIVYLPYDYGFIPHITLAYYNLNGFDSASAKKLEDAVTKLNKNSFKLELYTNELYYQKFTGMNSYTDIMRIT